MHVPGSVGDAHALVKVSTPPRPVGAAKRAASLRGLELLEMPMSLLTGGGGDEACLALQDEEQQPLKKSRPRRNRMKPLETWRNERILYERLPGSEAPSVRGVVLNAAGTSGGERPALAPLLVHQQGPAEESDEDEDDDLPSLKALKDATAVVAASRRQFLRQARAKTAVQ